MSQVDEGLIHAWLDGQLPPDEAARVEHLVATDAAWSAAAAEARGFVAGASRILNTLDTVPAAVPARRAGTGGGSRTGWRAPWMRAAAMLVIAAGLGGVLWQRLPQRASVADQEVLDSRNAKPQDAARPSAPPPVLAPAPPLASGGAPIVAAPATPAVRPSTAARESSALNELGRIDAAQGNAGVAGAGARPLGAAQSLTSPVPIPSAARDAKAVVRSEARQADQLSVLNLKQTDSIDSRLTGCWLKTDSAGRVAERDSVLLRFVPPAVTDRQGAAAPPVRPPAVAPPRTSGAAKDAPPPGAKVTNAMLNQPSPSTFAAMWVDEHGVTALQFTVKGDTIVGTARLSAGDVAYPLMAFRARRVACPP